MGETLVEASRVHRCGAYQLHNARFSTDATDPDHRPPDMQNAFSGRGAPTQTRQNAFSALAEPSQSPRFAQNNISQRVSFPAAQRNAFSTAPVNAFGGPSSQGHFQSAARQPPAPANNNSAFRRNTNAFNGSNALSNSSNAFSSSGFGGSGAQAQHQGLGGRDNAFARGAATPQSTGFGGGLSQQPLNAFAGAGTQQSFPTPPPRPPQHAAPAFNANNNRSGFNAFSGSQQPAATPTGFNNSNAFSASTANAFVSHAAAPSLAMQQGSQAPRNAFMGLQTCASHALTARKYAHVL